MTLFRKVPTTERMADIPDDESWKDWFERYGPKLLLCARQWTRSLADAEDVVQEGFVRFWRHQRQLGGEPQALLFTSVRRAAFDLARRNARRSDREERSDGGGDGAEALFETPLAGDDRRQVIEAALRRLPAEQREVLTLKIWGDLTFEQIAIQLGISPNTAASRYRYALGALRDVLTPADCHG
ncbi:MAG: sigma-70 family RNA polymerase sigma factor [Verrucomicrobiota bacterium]|nr:sigma-70 family RNA polymerase sigma factor [Opitutales bacterium]